MPCKPSAPVTVLLDNGIFTHSEFAEPAVIRETVLWGGTHQNVLMHGIRKKDRKSNPGLQAQIDALPTVGRLIRQGAIEAYEYREIWCERMRYRPTLTSGNALRGCEIVTCNAPLDRTKFMSTRNSSAYLARGGKKDRKAKRTGTSQISFLKFLCRLDQKNVDTLISNAENFRLSEFEVESLRNIRWFQFMCDRCGSTENYSDVLHLWAAERYGLWAFLTLDSGLPELVRRVRNEKKENDRDSHGGAYATRFSESTRD
jgi:hypothetical protein